MKKYLLRGLGLLGILLFVPLFSVTFYSPQTIEKSAKSFIEWKLNSELTEKIDALKLPQSQSLEKLLGTKAQEMYQKSNEKLVALKQKLKEDAPAIIATQIAKMSNLSCECRQKWEERLKTSMLLQMSTLEEASEKLIRFTQGKYMDILTKLIQDLRLFLGLNIFVFSLIFLASLMKPQITVHLFLPTVLIFFSTCLCSYFYVFEQNWFYTILYNDYVGLGYLAYLLVVFAFLYDIVFNKARVTTEIINVLAQAIGSTFSIATC